MPESVTVNLVCLHVFLHIGLLGKGSSADDALERFLSCVTVGRNGETSELDSLSSGFKVFYLMGTVYHAGQSLTF